MKIGTYSYPLYRLESLLSDARKIYDTFKTQEVSQEDIAALLQNSPTSGGFKQKLADMKSYNLIEGRANKIKISKLWIDAVFGTDEEQKQAYDKIVKGIPLWSTLLEKYPNGIPEEQFWVILRQITGVESPEAKEQANKVRKAYMDDIRYIKPVERTLEPSNNEKKPKKESEDRKSDMENTNLPKNIMPTSTPNAVAYIIFPDYVNAPFAIKDRDSFDVANKLMGMVEKKINTLFPAIQQAPLNNEENQGTEEKKVSKAIED